MMMLLAFAVSMLGGFFLHRSTEVVNVPGGFRIVFEWPGLVSGILLLALSGVLWGMEFTT